MHKPQSRAAAAKPEARRLEAVEAATVDLVASGEDSLS